MTLMIIWLLCNWIFWASFFLSSLWKRCLYRGDPTGWNVNTSQYLRYFSHMWPRQTFWKRHLILIFIFRIPTVLQALNIWAWVCKFLSRIVFFNFHLDLLASSKPKCDFFFFLLDLQHTVQNQPLQGKISDLSKHLFCFPIAYYPMQCFLWLQR